MHYDQGNTTHVFFGIYIIMKLTGKLKIVILEHLPVADNNMQAVLSDLNAQARFHLKSIRRHNDDLVFLCLIEDGACQRVF